MSEECHNLSHPKKRAFIAVYPAVGTISAAADAAGINRHTHYVWLKDDPEYAAAFADAEEKAADRLENEAIRRAVEGTVKPVFHQGAECGGIREYSDTLLIFLLKGLRPEKYRERYDYRGEMKAEICEVKVAIDGDWYGNEDRFAALSNAASTRDAAVSSPIQNRIVGPPGRENGNGSNGNGHGPRP